MAEREMRYKDSTEVSYKMAAAAIGGGNLVNINTGTGYAVAATDATARTFVGVAGSYKAAPSAAGGDSVAVMRDGVHLFSLYSADAAITDVGSLKVYVYDATTVAKTANTTYNLFVGIVVAVESASKVWVDITPATKAADVAAHIADSSDAHDSSAITFVDSGNKTSATQVDAALDEIYIELTSTYGLINIPMPHITDAGVALAAFADNSSPNPGFCVTAKGMGIRWNNNATQSQPVATKVLVPFDANITANMVLNIVAAKTGATSGDATTFTVVAYNNGVAALYDADTNFGGVSGAMTGDATAKTVQKVTRTLSAADLAASGSAIELTITPTSGTLGTDDVILLAMYITFTRKLRTS